LNIGEQWEEVGGQKGKHKTKMSASKEPKTRIKKDLTSKNATRLEKKRRSFKEVMQCGCKDRR